MLTDDEKFFHSAKLKQKECRQFAMQNAMDIIAIGFDVKKTFIFADSDFLETTFSAAFNENVREMGKRTTANQIRGTFGFTDSNNIAEFHFPAMHLRRLSQQVSLSSSVMILIKYLKFLVSFLAPLTKIRIFANAATTHPR